MINIFIGAFLGAFAGVFGGLSLVSYMLKKKISKLNKEAMKNTILGYTVIQYED